MARKKKNKKQQTFNVYPHLSDYGYFKTDVLPRFAEAGQVDILNQDALNEHMKNFKQTPTYDITSQTVGNVKEGYPSFQPYNIEGSNLGNLLNVFTGAKTFLQDDFSQGVIDPRTGRPYQKSQFYDISIENPTGRNTFLDADALETYLTSSKRKRKKLDKDSDFIMNELWKSPESVRQDAYTLLEQQRADHLQKHGLTGPSRTSMDIHGNITYDDVTYDTEELTDEYINAIQNIPFDQDLENHPDLQGIQKFKTGTRAWDPDLDMTDFDKIESELINYDVQSVNINDDGSITSFNKYTTKEDEDGIKKRIIEEESYDPNKNYLNIHRNVQEDINNQFKETSEARDGGRFPRRNLAAFVYGGDIPKAQNGTGMIGPQPQSIIPTDLRTTYDQWLVKNRLKDIPQVQMMFLNSIQGNVGKTSLDGEQVYDQIMPGHNLMFNPKGPIPPGLQQIMPNRLIKYPGNFRPKKNYGGDISYDTIPTESDSFSHYNIDVNPDNYKEQTWFDEMAAVNEQANLQNTGTITDPVQNRIDALNKSNSIMALTSGFKNTWDLLTNKQNGGEPDGEGNTTNLGFNWNRALRCGPGASCSSYGNPLSIIPNVGASYDVSNDLLNTEYGVGLRFNPFIEGGDWESQLMFNRLNQFNTGTDDFLTSTGDARNTLSFDFGQGRQFSHGAHDWKRDKQNYRYGVTADYDLTNKGLSNIGLYGQYGPIGGNVGYNPSTGGVNLGASLYFQDGGTPETNIETMISNDPSSQFIPQAVLNAKLGTDDGSNIATQLSETTEHHLSDDSDESRYGNLTADQIATFNMIANMGDKLIRPGSDPSDYVTGLDYYTSQGYDWYGNPLSYNLSGERIGNWSGAPLQYGSTHVPNLRTGTMFEDHPMYGGRQTNFSDGRYFGSNLHDYAQGVRDYYSNLPIENIDQGPGGAWAPTEFWTNPLSSIESFLTPNLRAVNEKITKKYGGSLPKAQPGGDINQIWDFGAQQPRFQSSFNRRPQEFWNIPGMPKEGYTYEDALNWRSKHGQHSVSDLYNFLYNTQVPWLTAGTPVDIKDRSTWENLNYGNPHFDFIKEASWYPQDQPSAHRMARELGMPVFFWQGQPIRTEQPGDNIYEWAQFYNKEDIENKLKGFSDLNPYINDLMEGIRTADIIEDPDSDDIGASSFSGEDYYNMLLKKAKESNDQTAYRLLRDLPKQNENYLDLFNEQVAGVKDLVNLQDEQVVSDYVNPILDEQVVSDYSYDPYFIKQAVDKTYVAPSNYNYYSTPMTSQGAVRQSHGSKILYDYLLDNDAFNKGNADEWVANWNADQRNAFLTDMSKGLMMPNPNYDPNKPESKDNPIKIEDKDQKAAFMAGDIDAMNPTTQQIYYAAQNQMDILNIGTETGVYATSPQGFLGVTGGNKIDLSQYGTNTLPEWVGDMRLSAFDVAYPSGYMYSSDQNIKMNRKNTSRDIRNKNWDNFWNKHGDAAGLFTQIPAGILDVGRDLVTGETWRRFEENPTLTTAGQGLWDLSIFANPYRMVGKGVSAGLRGANTMRNTMRGTSFNLPLRTNLRTMTTNYGDDLYLNNLMKFDKANPGLIYNSPSWAKNKPFTVNSPLTGSQFNLNRDMFINPSLTRLNAPTTFLGGKYGPLNPYNTGYYLTAPSLFDDTSGYGSFESDVLSPIMNLNNATLQNAGDDEIIYGPENLPKEDEGGVAGSENITNPLEENEKIQNKTVFNVDEGGPGSGTYQQYLDDVGGFDTDMYGTYDEYLVDAGDNPYTEEEWMSRNMENQGILSKEDWVAQNLENTLPDLDTGIDVKQNFWQKANETWKTSGVLNFAQSAFENVLDPARKFIDGILTGAETEDKQDWAKNEQDNSVSVFGEMESTRDAKGNLDFRNEDKKAFTQTLEETYGQLAQFGGESVVPNQGPDYTALAEFIPSDSNIKYNPEFLMMQARHGLETSNQDILNDPTFKTWYAGNASRPDVMSATSTQALLQLFLADIGMNDLPLFSNEIDPYGNIDKSQRPLDLSMKMINNPIRKKGGQVMDADATLIQQLIAAGADFEII